MRKVETDVVIIGAGAAGLAAADLLRNDEVEFILLEAADHVGGRATSFRAPRSGAVVERGAEFIHGRPGLLLDLLERAGLHADEADGTHLRRHKKELVEVDETFGKAIELLAGASAEHGTVKKFLAARGETKTEVGRLAAMFTAGFYAADPQWASAQVIGAMSRAALEEEGGDELHRVREGYSALMSFLAAPLQEQLWLGARATAIKWKQHDVRVTVERSVGETVEVSGMAVINTLPPTLLARNEPRYTPALADKLKASKTLDAGPIYKILVELRRWPDGFDPSRFVFLHETEALVPTWWRVTGESNPPLLQGWCAGPAARRLDKAKDRQAAVLQSLAKTSGIALAKLMAEVEIVSLHAWHEEPLARTGYAAFPHGSENAPLILSEPVAETLFFAGEATRLHDAGTVHGALASGYEAAATLLALFKG